MQTRSRFPEGFTALIQGASRGIGLGFVEALLAHQKTGRVIATCRNPSDSEGLSRLRAEHPERLICLPLDVEDEAAVAGLRDAASAEVDRLHLVINAAGVLHDGEGLFPEKKLDDLKLANLEKSFRVNAFGPLLVSRALAPLLTHREHAVLANISARVGSIGDNHLGGWYAYRGAKAAQNMFTRGVAVELGRRAKKLVCVALHPGTTDTGLSEPFQQRVPEHKLFPVSRTVEQLLAVIDTLGPEHSGRFFGWDGAEIPW